MLMHVPTRILLLRMIDERVYVARQRPITAGRVRREPTAACTARAAAFGTVLTVQSRVAWRTTAPWRLAPRDDGWPVFVIMAPTGLRFFRRPRAPRPNDFFPPCFAWPWWPAV